LQTQFLILAQEILEYQINRRPAKFILYRAKEFTSGPVFAGLSLPMAGNLHFINYWTLSVKTGLS
jgi:hypothetical protein